MIVVEPVEAPDGTPHTSLGLGSGSAHPSMPRRPRTGDEQAGGASQAGLVLLLTRARRAVPRTDGSAIVACGTLMVEHTF